MGTMTQDFNPSRYLVGFRDWYLLDDHHRHGFPSAEQMAQAALKKAPGFVAVIERFDQMNAVLARVEPAFTDAFLTRVRRLDEVEYCEHDYVLEKCSFASSLHALHRKGVSQDEGLAPHLSRSSAIRSGLGVCIALIDTGVSPHPFLPALSFRQASSSFFTVHPSIASQQTKSLLQRLHNAENQYRAPYDDPSEHQALLADVRAELTQEVDAAWQDWVQQLGGWLGQQRRQSPPSFPLSRSFLGAARMISPRSWNFLDDTPNVLDFDGHGTGMAGCISALPPLGAAILPSMSPVLTTNPALQAAINVADLKLLDHDINGLAPYAELLILKCLDERRAQERTLSTLIKALGYCLREVPDCIYIGFALKNQPQTPVLSLARRTAQVAAAGITMFAPAGNEGMAGLRMPAACPGVLAIASVDRTPKTRGYARTVYSSYADTTSSEEVHFCACGGTPDDPIQLLSIDFGFAHDYGTSVSTAASAAIFANGLSTRYQSATRALYSAQVNSHGQIDPVKVRQSIEGWKATANDAASVLSDMRNTSDLPPGATAGLLPHPEFGFGMPKL